MKRDRPVEPQFPVSTADAFDLATWWTRYALDRQHEDDRIFHPGVSSHGSAALTQLVAVEEALQHDQVDEAEVRTGAAAELVGHSHGT